MPKLVLLPGMDGTGDLFGDFITALPKSFTTVSARYPAEQCLSYSEILHHVRAICPASEPFTLLTESYSTPLGIRYAATRPPNLRSVVVCAGFAASPLAGWKRRAAALFAPIMFARPIPNIAIRAFLLDRDASPDLVALVYKAISFTSPDILLRRFRDVLACDVREELAQITAPLLYIQATRDRLIGDANVKTIKAIKPETSVVTIDAPHLVLQTQPRKTADVVADFLRECDG